MDLEGENAMSWLRDIIDPDESTDVDPPADFEWLDNPTLVKIAFAVAIIGVMAGCITAVAKLL